MIRKVLLAHCMALGAIVIQLLVCLAQAHREHKVHNIVLYPDKHSWCKTTTIKQVINYPGCTSVEIDNNVCVGACFSYSIPHTEPSDPGEVIVPYCDSCQPAETTWHQITLQCDKNDSDTPPQLIKHVQIIQNCSCTPCEKDRYKSIASSAKFGSSVDGISGGGSSDDLTGDLLLIQQQHQHYQEQQQQQHHQQQPTQAADLLDAMMQLRSNETSAPASAHNHIQQYQNGTMSILGGNINNNNNNNNKNSDNNNSNSSPPIKPNQDEITPPVIGDRWKKTHALLNQKIYTLIKNVQVNNTRQDKEQLMDLLNVIAHQQQQQQPILAKTTIPDIADFIETLRNDRPLEQPEIQRLSEILLKFEHSKFYRKQMELTKHHLRPSPSSMDMDSDDKGAFNNNEEDRTAADDDDEDREVGGGGGGGGGAGVHEDDDDEYPFELSRKNSDYDEEAAVVAGDIVGSDRDSTKSSSSSSSLAGLIATDDKFVSPVPNEKPAGPSISIKPLWIHTTSMEDVEEEGRAVDDDESEAKMKVTAEKVIPAKLDEIKVGRHHQQHHQQHHGHVIEMQSETKEELPIEETKLLQKVAQGHYPQQDEIILVNGRENGGVGGKGDNLGSGGNIVEPFEHPNSPHPYQHPHTHQQHPHAHPHHHHVVNENIVPHGHLTRGPHGALVIEPDRIHEKLDVNAHELKPNHAGTLLSYHSHSEKGVKQH